MLTTFCTLAALGLGLHIFQLSRLHAVAVEVNGARSGVHPQASPVDFLASSTDYTTSFPQAAPAEPVLRQFQRSASKAGVTIGSLNVGQANASPIALGHSELELNMRGAYAPIKAVVGEVLDRYPNLLLQRLNLQRIPASTELDARAEFVLLTRPLSSAGTPQ